MKRSDVINNALLTDRIKSMYGIFYTDKGIFFVTHTVCSIGVSFSKIKRIESNENTISFHCSKQIVSIFKESVITMVNIF